MSRDLVLERTSAPGPNSLHSPRKAICPSWTFGYGAATQPGDNEQPTQTRKQSGVRRMKPKIPPGNIRLRMGGRGGGNTMLAAMPFAQMATGVYEILASLVRSMLSRIRSVHISYHCEPVTTSISLKVHKRESLYHVYTPYAYAWTKTYLFFWPISVATAKVGVLRNPSTKTPSAICRWVCAIATFRT